MTREVSIIIPSCNFDYLQKCIASIIRYTDFREINAEFIIAANGLPIEAKEWLDALSPPFRHIWMDEKCGEIIPVNSAVKIAESELVGKMDDDNILLPWALNQNWIRRLLLPFQDAKVGLVSPVVFKYKNQWIDRGDCIVGFLFVTRKSIWNQIGGFDELLSPGIGTDTDYNFKTQELGYTISLPANDTCDGWHPEGNMYGGSFPIFHHSIMSHNPENLKIRQEKIDLLNKRWGNVPQEE